ATDAGRVDQAKAVAVALELGVYGVARGARRRRHDRALLVEQPVEQRRFADVGPADNRHVDHWERRRPVRFIQRRLARSVFNLRLALSLRPICGGLRTIESLLLG